MSAEFLNIYWSDRVTSSSFRVCQALQTTVYLSSSQTHTHTHIQRERERECVLSIKVNGQYHKVRAIVY